MARKEGKEHPTVFISYSHKDEEWKDRLLPHLGTLEQQGDIVIWDDRKIGTGDDWYPAIKEQLEKAAVAVCLISANYLSSKFINKEEIPDLKQKRTKEGMLLLPVLISPCPWKTVRWLKGIQLFPPDDKSLEEIRGRAKQERALSEIAEYIYEKIADPSFELAAPAVKWAAPEKADIDKLPETGQELFGRQKELEILDEVWGSDEIGVISFVAWGGVGKSTLVKKWLELMSIDNYRGAKRVYCWSFYSQGTSERVTSADMFINEALEWFGDPNPKEGSEWEKGKRLAKLVQEEKTLLILDGMEPLQSSLEFEKGKIKDAALSVLVTELGRENPGLCVITTRENVPELGRFETSTREVDLDQISNEAGSALLRVGGVRGDDGELEKATEAFGNHALAINLLASYLHGIAGHHISNAAKIADINVPVEKGRHPRRVMEAFDKRFGKGSKGEILRIMGLFDRPAELAAIKAVRAAPAIAGLTEYLQGIKETEWNKLLEELRDCKLLAPESKHNPDVVDCHPLVREHFGEKLKNERPKAWREAHKRLYEYYKGLPEKLYGKHLPDKLEEMEPLFRAVYHGCAAGEPTKVWEEVYWKRIKRGNDHYSTAKLGAFGSDLGAVACFFEKVWDKPAARLSEHRKALVLNLAGYRLRALGRLRESAEAFESARWNYEKAGDPKEIAIAIMNLSELYLTLGEVGKAVEYGHRCIEYADKSGDAFHRMSKRTTLADALHQAGEIGEAKRLFEEAEGIQKERQPGYEYMYSLPGYRYCDLLLALGEYEEVKKRARQTLEWMTNDPHAPVLTVVLDKLSLGRAELTELRIEKLEGKGAEKCLTEAKKWLDEAVDGLRKAGQQDYLPLGLLARAGYYRYQRSWDRARGDLEEVREIAERGEMKLFQADYHLEAARLCLAQAEDPTSLKELRRAGRSQRSEVRISKEKEEGKNAKWHYDEARRLVEECGYHRRDEELEELENSE